MFDSVNSQQKLDMADLRIPRRLAATKPACASSVLKRGLDLMVSVPVILFILPVLVLIAVLIKLDSRGPVLFRQRRTGLDGKPFNIYKFRSMTVQENGSLVVQAKADDKRVTRIGKFLRKTSLDEVPQLLNIVKGDMSLVGPRPHAASHDAQFATQVSAYNERFDAKPGLTGLAQVRGYRGELMCRADLENRINADIEYIRTWSFIHDVVIIARTVPLIFGDKRAY